MTRPEEVSPIVRLHKMRQRTLVIPDNLFYHIANQCVAQGMECDALAHTLRLRLPELLHEWFAQVLTEVAP